MKEAHSVSDSGDSGEQQRLGREGAGPVDREQRGRCARRADRVRARVPADLRPPRAPKDSQETGATGGPKKTFGRNGTALGNAGPLHSEGPAVLPLLPSGPAVLEDRAGQGSQHSLDLPRCCLPEASGMESEPWGCCLRGQGRGKRRRGPTHPGLLSSGALLPCEALWGQREAVR